MNNNRLILIITHPLLFFGAILSFLRYYWRFKEYHISDIIKKPIHLTPRFISLGEHVYIGPNARIDGVSKYNDKLFHPQILLSDRVKIQQGIHLTCANSVVIGRNTAIAAYVTITDINHPYTDINLPIERQDLEVKAVKIGEDCKIYNGAVILPGVTIGNHVTVGANSVVNRDVPDFCVVAGIPAVIVRRYDLETKNWRRTKLDGTFVE